MVSVEFEVEDQTWLIEADLIDGEFDIEYIGDIHHTYNHRFHYINEKIMDRAREALSRYI